MNTEILLAITLVLFAAYTVYMFCRVRHWTIRAVSAEFTIDRLRAEISTERASRSINEAQESISRAVEGGRHALHAQPRTAQENRDIACRAVEAEARRKIAASPIAQVIDARLETLEETIRRLVEAVAAHR